MLGEAGEYKNIHGDLGGCQHVAATDAIQLERTIKLRKKRSTSVAGRGNGLRPFNGPPFTYLWPLSYLMRKGTVRVHYCRAPTLI